MRQLLIHVGVFLVVGVMLWRLKVGGLSPRLQRLIDVAEVLLLVGLVAYVGRIAYLNVTSPFPWDFPVFYTVARNTVDGVSIYDPQALLPTFQIIQEQAGVPPDWINEFGFWYAPPTALVLAPLGVSDYSTGLIIQYLTQGAFFVGSVFLLHRIHPLRAGAMGLVEMAILFLAFRPVLSAFQLAQIVFGALFAIAIAVWAIRDRPWIAGLSLGVGALFKHLLLIPAVLSLALRKWRIAVGSLIAIAGAAIITGLVLGFDIYRQFSTFGPSDRPAELALDPVIESLNGVLRRLFQDVPTGPGAIDAILYPPYLVAAAVLTVVTLLITRRAHGEPDATELGFALIILLSLLVYPNTLFNTLPLMLPALVVVLAKAQRLPFDPKVTVLIVAVQYGLVATRAIPGFLALMIAWVYLAICLVVMVRRSNQAESLRGQTGAEVAD